MQEVAILAFPYVPAYNIPSLRSSPPLNFSLVEITEIYLGRIEARDSLEVSVLSMVYLIEFCSNCSGGTTAI